MKVKDRVKMEPMWKYKSAEGSVIKIQKDGYVIVKWDGINGKQKEKRLLDYNRRRLKRKETEI